MTYEEFESLKPGDKVVFILEYKDLGYSWVNNIHKMQEEYEGTLTIKKVFPHPKDSESPEGTDFWIENDKTGCVYDYSWFELYKPKPWTYEKDY